MTAVSSAERSPDDVSAVVAAVWLCSLGTVATYILPLLVDGAMADLHFSERSAGLLSSGIMAGGVVSALLSGLWVRRIRWQSAARIAVLGQLAATLASLVFHTNIAFILLQSLAGFFGGAVNSLAMTVLSDGRHPARSFGFSVAAQATLSAVELLAGPYLLGVGGMNAVLWTLVAMSVASLPFCGNLPPMSRLAIVPRAWRGHVTAPVVLSLAGCFLFYSCIGSYWTYIGLVGATAKLSPQTVGNALAASTVIGIGGALLPSWFGERHGYHKPLMIGALLTAVAGLLIVAPVSPLRFVASATVFNIGWNYWVTYQLAVVAVVDRSGRSIAVSQAFLSGGGAAGAAVAALFVTASNQSSLVWLVLAATSSALVCFIAALEMSPRVRPAALGAS